MRTLQQLFVRWNELVPMAQARGLRVRPIRSLHENRAAGERRVSWLEAMVAPVGLGTQTFGVELEFVMPRNMNAYTLADTLTRAGIATQVQSYGHDVPRTFWKIVTDGSLPSNGRELVSPPLQDQDGFDKLALACRTLTAARVKITRSCGFHVHVQSRVNSVNWLRNTVKMYAHYTPAVETLVAPSRRRSSNNAWCRPVNYNIGAMDRALTSEQVASAAYQTPRAGRHTTRYKTVNLESYWSYGTIEFRHHQGTVDARKAEMWVRFCLRLSAEAAEADNFNPAEHAPTFEGLMGKVKATPAEIEFFTQRQTQLGGTVAH
jgi:Putative amidoligase enzyme